MLLNRMCAIRSLGYADCCDMVDRWGENGSHRKEIR
jgi:hypothetical protein